MKRIMMRYKEHFLEGESDCTVVSDIQEALEDKKWENVEEVNPNPKRKSRGCVAPTEKMTSS